MPAGSCRVAAIPPARDGKAGTTFHAHGSGPASSAGGVGYAIAGPWIGRGSRAFAGADAGVDRPTLATVTPDEFANLAYLRRARDLMDREYARPLDVAALARAALMSNAHFSRQFRETYGETPYAYLMTRRIERAKALLASRRAVGHRGLHGGRLYVARLVQRALHRARWRDADCLPGP